MLTVAKPFTQGTILFLPIYSVIYFFAVKESPLRIFFRRIDLDANDELDVHELQRFFHDIEPEDPIPDFDRLVHTMRRTMKLVSYKKERSFTVSWEQFRKNYAEIDTVTEAGAPEVRLLPFIAE